MPESRLLLVEDEGKLAASLGDMLELLAPQTTVTVASTLGEAAAALRAARFDAVLLDLGLPDSQGLDTFHALRAQAPDTALVVITGRGDEELVAAAFAEGAQDYLIKGSFSGELLVRAVRGAVERQRLVRDLREGEARLRGVVAEQRAAERARSEAETRLRQVIARSPAVLYAMTPAPPHDVTWMSENSGRILGFAPDEFRTQPGLWSERVHPDDAPHLPAKDEALIADDDSINYEYRFRHADGHWLWVSDTLTMVRGSDGTALEIVAACQDVTAERHLEEQLRQAQKMEAVGQLAGGVAHDFNNLLTAINGYSELLLMRLAAEDPARHEVEEIHRAGERAATLTRQLLAFSRRQMLQPRVLDLNAVVVGIEAMLHRLIGEHMRLATELAPGPLPVKADPGQLEQVLVNLAVNARDAMPEGGRLTISTGKLEVRAQEPRHPDAHPGRFAFLRVADTGHGMDAATVGRIFEPFFTTKATGKGTGLGLSTVYGIVKQSGGWIEVESEPGKGAVFTVCLPALPEVGEAAEPPRVVGASEGAGAEMVLVVEDEPAVRALVCRALRARGYAVLEAPNGSEALALAERHPGEIQLLLTDVVMPDVRGPELRRRLLARRPGLRTVFMSGYSEVGGLGLGEPGVAFVQKPFTPDGLLRTVRETLDGPPRVPSA